MTPNDEARTVDATIGRLLDQAHRIAVVGIKTEAQADQAAFFVPAYLVEVGYDVVPVPVYYPEVTTLLGRPVVRQLVDVQPPPELVVLFRRPADVALQG